MTEKRSTPPQFFAEARSIDDLHAAARSRAEQLQMTRLDCDFFAGIADGQSSRLLAPKPTKHFGVNSLFPVLRTLRLKLQVVEDHDAPQFSFEKRRRPNQYTKAAQSP